MRPNHNSSIEKALGLHKEGKIEQSLTLATKLIASFPTNPVLLHLIGQIKQHQGKQTEALSFVKRSCDLAPTELSYKVTLANLYHQLECHNEAIAQYLALLKIDSGNNHLLNNLGVSYGKLGLYQEAIALFTRILATDSDFIQAQNNRANLLKILGDEEAALRDYSDIIQKKPDYAPAYNNRGNLFLYAKKPDLALESYTKAVQLDPDYAEAWSNKGNAESALGRYEDALKSYNESLRANKRFLGGLLNKGSLLHALGRPREAHLVFSSAAELHPSSWEAVYNRGITNQALNKFVDAIADYDTCLQLRPNFAEARWNKSLCLLTLGKYEEGFSLYEERWNTLRPVRRRHDLGKLWDGLTTISNRTFLVFAEQGFGDTIQFCRFIPQLAQHGARIKFAAQGQLIPLLRSLDGIISLHDFETVSTEADFHIPLMSLPRLLKLRYPIASKKPKYLEPSAKSMAFWGKRLDKKKRKRIGIAWRGSANHPNDRNRSMSLKSLNNIFSLNLDYFSLCADPNEAEINLLAELDIATNHQYLANFDLTAALIENLDLVITVDTSIAHLSGSLGKRTIVLLPYCPDWRWGLKTETTDWYPTLRLLRQDEFGDWEVVVNRLRAELKEMIAEWESS